MKYVGVMENWKMSGSASYAFGVLSIFTPCCLWISSTPTFIYKKLLCKSGIYFILYVLWILFKIYLYLNELLVHFLNNVLFVLLLKRIYPCNIVCKYFSFIDKYSYSLFTLHFWNKLWVFFMLCLLSNSFPHL